MNMEKGSILDITVSKLAFGGRDWPGWTASWSFATGPCPDRPSGPR